MITEQQRQERVNGIGGSDAPVLLGLSPHKTAFQLWMEKTGQAEPENLDDVERVRWGNILESVIADEYARRTGLTLRRVNGTLHHPEHPFMIGHIDRRIVGQPALVEIKTVARLADGAPRPDHVAQVQHYLAVTGWQVAHIVYLVSGREMRSCVVGRDDVFIADLIEIERRFWEHVTARTPPPPRTVAELRLAFPRDTGQAVHADPDTLAAVERLRAITAERKRIEALEEIEQAAILKAMGEASELIDEHGRQLATWKAPKPSRTFDAKRFQDEHPELASQYMVERQPARRFLLKQTREGEQ